LDIMKFTAIRLAVPAALLLALAGCEAEKSSNPLSPSVAGPIAGVEISQPKLLEPDQGFKFKESQQPIRLLIENAASTGVRPITYIFEVAADSEFQTKVFARSNVAPGDDGRTAVMVDRLEAGRPYYWRARAEDGANTGQFATAAFEVLPKPRLDPPGVQSPANGAVVGSRRPELRVGNANRNPAVSSPTYEFQVSLNQSFTALVSAGTVGEGNGSTAFTVNTDLAFNTTHFWRVRASDGETTSEWAPTQSFRTPVAPSAPPPGPAPGPAPGGPCIAGSPEAVVECERAKFGFMSRSQMAAFMRAVARSLNASGISGGPYGILRKAGGNQCGGYSCDVICAGQGNAQRQWDVLGDIEGDQSPGWSGPHTVPHIRVDVCEIQ
jgi:hypothetical protein